MLSNEFSLSEYTKIDLDWGFDFGVICSALPQTPYLVSRGPLRGRRGMEGRERTRGRGIRKGGMGKGGRKGGSWGNSALVVGG